MRTIWALKAKSEVGKVQRLASSQEWPGVVLFGGVFYNYTYVNRLFKDSMNALQ
jgi:hypothetical protein